MSANAPECTAAVGSAGLRQADGLGALPHPACCRPAKAPLARCSAPTPRSGGSIASWAAGGVTTRLGTERTGRYTEERIAARVAALGLRRRGRRVEERGWLLAEVAAELGAHRLTVAPADGLPQDPMETAHTRVASGVRHGAPGAVGVVACAGHSWRSSDLASYLRRRHAEEGWSVKRIRPSFGSQAAGKELAWAEHRPWPPGAGPGALVLRCCRSRFIAGWPGTAAAPSRPVPARSPGTSNAVLQPGRSPRARPAPTPAARFRTQGWHGFCGPGRSLGLPRSGRSDLGPLTTQTTLARSTERACLNLPASCRVSPPSCLGGDGR
jgi:hypothetical protein